MGGRTILRMLTISCIITIATSTEDSMYLDMTYTFNEDTLHWPTLGDFQFTVLFRNYTMGGDLYLESNSFCTAEHLGTHMDSPVHMSMGSLRTHEVPLDQLIGPAIRVNIKSKADQDPDALLEVSDLESWEDDNGRIPDDVILMVYSGWGARWPDKNRYIGTNTTNTTLMHFPGISPEAAQWLVDNRKIKAVGIDTPSIDHAPATMFPSHQILYAQDIPGFENVANLDKLPTKGSTIFAIPMKIGEGSGAPLRIFATGWHDDIQDPCSVGMATKITSTYGVFLFSILLCIGFCN